MRRRNAELNDEFNEIQIEMKMEEKRRQLKEEIWKIYKEFHKRHFTELEVK